MKTIWKYRLPVMDEVTLQLPRHSTILTVQMQEDSLCLWAVVDPKMLLQPRNFRIYGTGNPIDQIGEYISTVQDGSFVWHIFEV